MGQICPVLDVPWLKRCQLQGRGLDSSVPLTRALPLDPTGALPHISVIGSRSALAMSPNSEIGRDAADEGTHVSRLDSCDANDEYRSLWQQQLQPANKDCTVLTKV